jgi:hypothetical protein
VRTARPGPQSLGSDPYHASVAGMVEASMLQRVVLPALVGLAVLLRLTGVAFGLPMIVHPDPLNGPTIHVFRYPP